MLPKLSIPSIASGFMLPDHTSTACTPCYATKRKNWTVHAGCLGGGDGDGDRAMFVNYR
ncbi:Protein of unknown function [Pyronema omphalodes CBS 100304]|uniref:Uncharacterized protein n=1 Tax=Pyronema omphalodes (strain CBS 100304) TaxID=1076935 RepID=U4LP84_PYROM|nr:Protein of unknown function [Pyronema omphalodes CBS 100304]